MAATLPVGPAGHLLTAAYAAFGSGLTAVTGCAAVLFLGLTVLCGRTLR